MNFSGWLINLLIEDDTAYLIFKTADGKKAVITDSYEPYFYIIPEGNPDRIRHMISQHPDVTGAFLVEKYPYIESERKVPLVKVVVDGVPSFMKVARDSLRIPGIKDLAETGLPHYFRYMMERDLRIFRKYEIETEGGRLVSSSMVATEELPELNQAAICPGRDSPLSMLTGDGNVIGFELQQLGGLIDEKRIDVVFTFGGDAFLSGNTARDADERRVSCAIPGCIHIDVRRDIGTDIYSDEFVIPEDGWRKERLLEVGRERMLRIMELSRITGVRPDIVSRVTPGRLNTYLHMRAARERGYVVPDKKRAIEKPKSLRELNVLDKGGLIFYPEPGLYYGVAKCDFASMYPNIIVNFNISPETVNCRCCPKDGIRVPETDWHICSKRKGVIPEGIKPVVDTRLKLKRMMRDSESPEEKRMLDLRQRALKNILVTCFGYLGFKNFIFSNVECKESVMLYGRQILMRTKTIAERMGLDVIYGITDSVFVHGGDEALHGEFLKAVRKETGIDLELDGVFKAIAFPCSDDNSGVANKYYGLTYDDEMECRGINIRHSNAPPILKMFQESFIRSLMDGGKLRERIHENFRRSMGILNAFKSLVLEDRLPINAYAISISVRRA